MRICDVMLELQARLLIVIPVILQSQLERRMSYCIFETSVKQLVPHSFRGSRIVRVVRIVFVVAIVPIVFYM